MGDGTQSPKCPFYPESCMVERHPNQQHRWKESVLVKDVARRVVEAGSVLKVVTHEPVCVTARVTNAERQARWREAHKAEVKKRNRERMAVRRGEKKSKAPG